MKSIVTSSLILALLLSLLSPVLLAGGRAAAQEPEVCYGVADNDDTAPNDSSADQLVSFDRVTGNVAAVGSGTGTAHVEAIAFDLDGETLYAADASRFGTIDTTTGVFTEISASFGTGDDGAGNLLTFSDVDGLAFDPTTGELYGAHREGATNDVLFKIDKSSGTFVADAFGPGIDYVVIPGPAERQDIDDIAIEPGTGTIYAAANDGGSGGSLIMIEVDPNTAAVTDTLIGAFGYDDIEGLAFFPDGQLHGSSGEFSDTTADIYENNLFVIDKDTGAATPIGSFVTADVQFTDYEALGCLTEPTSVGLSTISASGGNGVGFNITLLLGLLVVATLASIVVWRRVSAPVEA